jgi:DNA primase
VSYQDVLQADIRVVTLPAGEDPDSLVRADPERFRALVEGARPVVDHLFEAVAAQFDLADPRARSRALDALAPSVAGITDAVVRAHYVQRLARMLQLDERAVLALLSRQRGQRPSPVPTSKEVRQVRRGAIGPAPAVDGEFGLLQLLLQRDECREVRESIDADVFEDSANRRLFEAWRDGTAALPLAELDEDLHAAYQAVTNEAPDWLDARILDGRVVGEMAISWAKGLRRQRLGARLAPAAREHAEQAGVARREGAAVLDYAVRERGEGEPVVPESDAEAASMAYELNAIVARQRELARIFRIESGRQPAVVADGDPKGAHHDSDV